MTKIRWGILGTGRIAGNFAEGLSAVEDAEIVAVGSRTQESADAFAERFQIPHRHPTYAGLADDPDVDIVYVATPHPLHKDNTILCLNAGKGVLCEKPFAINAAEARIMVETARSAGVFLMEAMWSRFLPHMRELVRRIAAGEIGEIRLLQADFGFRTKVNPAGRLFDPALGGGALLDVGIYPVSLAHMILGQPTRSKSLAHLGETGVDEVAGILFQYDSGALAVLSTAIRASTRQGVTISGTSGHIQIQQPWWRPTSFTINRDGHEPETVEIPTVGNGMNYEAVECGRCLREGLAESPLMPLDETVAIMRVLDSLRAEWGLRYPMEQKEQIQ